MQNTFYKYTSVDTFNKIIDNKSLLLTDIQESNDTSELRLVYGIVKQVFEEEYMRDIPQYMLDYFPLSKFREFYKMSTHYIDSIENIIHTQYVTCLSERGDMLSQWRGYGDDGRGISIGFDITTFPVDEFYKFGKVEYNEIKQKALFRSEIKEIIKKLRASVKTTKTIDDYPVQSFMRDYNILLLKAVFVKNPFFREEREWRYSCWHSKQKKYWTINISENAINEVIIGPKCQLSKDQVEAMLNEKNFRGYTVSYSMGHGIYVDSKNQKNISRLETEPIVF